ncbi:MAG: 30S ribosomal protein S18 [Candidatus Gracilibacteria bacterium]|jgi:small subunit ribosomal protein S18|nr:30S ribosomal protein S18 [Candidatus Gracilibacteria bacterium]
MSTYENRKCEFCQEQIKHIDYKNVSLLKKYITYFSKIKPRYYTGTCLRHQKKLAVAIKRARHLALLPFVK